MNRQTAGWVFSYAYLAYIYLGQLPPLSGQPAFSPMVESVALLAAFVLSTVLVLGARKSLALFLIATITGSAMEALSVATGIPFGRYLYTKALGSTLGTVPVAIPFFWAALSFYSLEAGGTYGMPVLMTLLDLSFDPLYSGRLWIWTSGTQYFGVPWSNFVGWLITSVVIIVLYTVVARRRETPALRGIVFYFMLGVNYCISDIYANLLTPALVSFVAFAISSSALFLYSWHQTKKPKGGLTSGKGSGAMPA